MVLWQLEARREPFEQYNNAYQIAKYISEGNKENIIDYNIDSTIKKIIE